ncbi:MAG: helix-turn-helix domain-containing protein [Prolixibacteraceae bacterium]|jgi:excisionase family DNA binding protein|nr:helix-turn-helix domain-containing protein [Prolixibacteraceae bacterium]
MSSNIEILKICEFCNEKFIAKTTVTRFCGHSCASRSYKQRLKENKIDLSIEKTNKEKVLKTQDLGLEVIKQKEFLSIKDAYTLLGISERTFYRLMKIGTIKTIKIGGRTIIKRSEIDRL